MSPASHAGNACSQPACRCASSRARLQGAHSPRLSNVQEGSAFTRDTDQRPRRARRLRPAPGSLSRSRRASEDPWGGWHGAEVGTGRERQHRRCFPHQKQPLLIGGCGRSTQTSAPPDSRGGTGTSESLGRRPSLRPQLGEEGGGALPSPARLFQGLLTACGADRGQPHKGTVRCHTHLGRPWDSTEGPESCDPRPSSSPSAAWGGRAGVPRGRASSLGRARAYTAKTWRQRTEAPGRWAQTPPPPGAWA